MAGKYDSIISNATAAYNKTVTGYQTALAQQQAQQQSVIGQYNAGQAAVLRGLEGSSEAANQQINDQYAAASGKGQMDLIRRGLGNSTVLSAVQRGLNIDQAKAQTNRLNEFAKTAAGYQTQWGLAGLGYAGHALDQNMNFIGQGLGYAGEGAFKLGNLAEGFAGLENQSQMQKDAFAQQIKMQRLNQLYGAGGGGGGGHIGSFDKPLGGPTANRDNTTGPAYAAPYSHNGYVPPGTRAADGSSYGGFGGGNYGSGSYGGFGDTQTITPYGGMGIDDQFVQNASVGGDAGGGGFYDPWGEEA